MADKDAIQKLAAKFDAWASSLSPEEQSMLAEWWATKGDADVSGFSAAWWQSEGAWSNAWESSWSG